MSEHFFKYLEEKYPVGSCVPISEIRSLKRKYNEVAEFSDIDEQELVAAAEKAEKEYRKRQRMNEEPVFSPCNEEELFRLVDSVEKESKKPRYACETCGKTYAWKKHLNRHIQIHSMTFSCQCGKSLTRKENLKNHKMVCKHARSSTVTHEEI